ncbi:magnesium transporter [Ruicaihuangia caeni]|uniref:Magnesium transporter MgtE n=1 Tax=Ruicaihuangia caeni TaxID=3042517 RepID=A0AAW6T5B4_9MICO|nr:magnesium transporter [Klugiella sp. YN-L-19]MDI2097534.1 magnesium transporter [Klugiella sp. YN-L-19]
MADRSTEQEVEQALAEDRLAEAARLLRSLTPREVVGLIERTTWRRGAVVFRLLGKDRAMEVFERLGSTMQGELLRGLQDEDVARLFAKLEPDDRVRLLDEVPAAVAKRLLATLDADELATTHLMLGYPSRSVGRQMSLAHVTTRPDSTVAETLERVRERARDAATVYTVFVTDHERGLLGVLTLRSLFESDPAREVGELMQPAESAPVDADAEETARMCEALQEPIPIVDSEQRLIGIFTIDDAHRVLQDAEAEDIARAGAREPLRRPYLSTSILYIARSRVVWLFVLAISALLTVQVLEIFESTLEQLVALALFIPLLTGTAGNTGSQAATTITRALAVAELRPGDIGKVLFRELRVGALLGLLLGSAGFALASLVYGLPMGVVIGTTLLFVCSIAATVGGAMPLIARAIRVDPAVFSTPFITTFCDATGLVIYFTVAKAVLQI